MTYPSLSARVLAIDPTTKGFAYAVLEGPGLLIDWGSTQAAPQRKNLTCLKRIADLIERYDPDVLLFEAYAGRDFRRCARIQALFRCVHRLSARRHLRSRAFSRAEVRKAFAALGDTTKEAIARSIGNRFPELGPHLPRVRKPWMSEDERMSIFDAVALAVTYFDSRRKRFKSPAETTQLPLAA